MTTETTQGSTWQDLLGADYATPGDFSSAVKSSLASFKKDLNETRNRYPTALIDCADRHHEHALGTHSLPEWTDPLDHAVTLSRSLQLSRHHTTPGHVPDLKRAILRCDATDLASLARSNQLDLDVIKGWKRVWATMKQIDDVAKTSLSDVAKDGLVKSYEKNMRSNWTVRDLERHAPHEVANAMPAWWASNKESWLSVPTGNAADPRSSEETIRQARYPAAGGFVDSPEELSEVDG